MISNRCARKSLVTNCNSIISKNYLRFLVDSNDILYKINRNKINHILFITWTTRGPNLLQWFF